MARYPKRRSRRGGPGVGAIVLGLVLGAVLVSAVAAYGWINATQGAEDPDTLCPTSGPTAITVIAIDASDPYDAVQVQEIDNRVRRMLGSLERGHRLDVYTMNAQRGDLATEVFSRCNPGRTTRLDQVAGQPTLVERRYREEFSDAIDMALDRAITTGTAQTSPIVESVRAIAASSLGRDDGDIPRRLIIVSDLIQHSEVYSMYRSGIEAFEAFSRTANYADAQTNLRGAEIDLIVILRAEYAAFQTRAMVLWWEDYARANNGRVIDSSRI